MKSGKKEVSRFEFAARLRRGSFKPDEIEQFLDSLNHRERVAEIRSLTGLEQRVLYESVEGFRPVRLTDLVPPMIGDFNTVRHYGKNALPVFSYFEKRFCRPRGANLEQPVELYGFNFQALSSLTGPGYFVAREDPDRPEVLIDYQRLPGDCPADWPRIRSNERGLSRLVYGSMVDTLRGVSTHVTIGTAARKGKDLDTWFILCREEQDSSQ